MAVEGIERRICDRCDASTESHRAFGAGWSQVKSEVFGVAPSGEGKTVNLCSDCRDALVRWMREGQREAR
jgi:hypothetical protein